MKPNELLFIVEGLPSRLPLTDELEGGGIEPSYEGVWYSSQQEHWRGWLGNYDGPGAYGRANHNRDAKFIYNHFQCPPGLLWLAEALGIDHTLLLTGRDAIVSTGGRLASQCAAFRRVVPWSMIEEALERYLDDYDLKMLIFRSDEADNPARVAARFIDRLNGQNRSIYELKRIALQAGDMGNSANLAFLFLDRLTEEA